MFTMSNDDGTDAKIKILLASHEIRTTITVSSITNDVGSQFTNKHTQFSISIYINCIRDDGSSSSSYGGLVTI